MQGSNHVSYISCTGRQVLYHQSHLGSPRQLSKVTEKLLYNIPSLPHWYLLCSLVAKSCPNLCNPWTVAHQAPLSMDFSRQEYWSGLPFPPLGDLPHPGIESGLPHCRWILYHLSHQGSLPPLKMALILFLINFYGSIVALLINIMCQLLLYSKVNQLYIYVYPLHFGLPSSLGHHRTVNRVPCAIQSILSSYLFYVCEYMLVVKLCPTLL